MPRPGPRPYECVRRTWHSDSHQPIRGTIIKEIFRAVKENHSSATQNNKEWQDKLPTVVLRVEEIMYSKANSEAEYMDIQTLWERANDAINTIIRLDEGAETEGLLQPCIEAALNLGCEARRSSRSQRNSSPRCYLNPMNQEPPSAPLSILDYTAQGPNPNPDLESHDLVASNCSWRSAKFPFPFKLAPLPTTVNQRLAMKGNPAQNKCSVYPLYFGDCPQINGTDESCVKFKSKVGALQNVFLCPEHALCKSTWPDSRGIVKVTADSGCDLSLRLGPLNIPYSMESS